MRPDSSRHTPSTAALRALVQRCQELHGLSQAGVAARIGISPRRLEYLLAGSRGEKLVVMTYPEQFALEALAR